MHARLLVLVVLATLALGVCAFDDLPSFPSMPASLLEIQALSEPSEHAIGLKEPAAASADALVELDSASELPSSEVALAAAFPSSASNPLTAALAIEVPNPNTFLKDDVFLQQLEREHLVAEQREAAEMGGEASGSSEGFFDDLISKRPLQEPPRRNRGRAPAGGKQRKGASKGEDETARLTDLYNNRPASKAAGRFLSRKGGIFQGHQRGSHKTRYPEHDQAPHQEDIPRTYRSARGHFEKNLAFRDSNSPVDSPFPHHGGHVKAPHNKGRKNAKANLPKKLLSRHLLAQKKGSKVNRFPKAKSQRAERAAARRAAAKRRSDRLSGKKLSKAKGRNGRHVRHRKGKGLNVARASKGRKGGKGGKAGKGGKGGRGGKGKAGKNGRHGSKGGKGKGGLQGRKGGKGGKAGRGGKGGKLGSHAGKGGKHGSKGGKHGSKGGKHNQHHGHGKHGKNGHGKPGHGRGKHGHQHHQHGKHDSKHGKGGKPKDQSIIGGLGKLLHDKTRDVAKKVEAKSNQLFNKAEKSVHKGIASVADKLKSKVAGWGGFGEVLTKGINKLQDGAHKSVDKARDNLQGKVNGVIADTKAGVHNQINTSVQRAKNALKNRFGGFFTMAELKAEIAQQRRKGGGSARKQAAPATAFPTGFDHVMEQRADMRADVQKFKDEEFATVQAKADLEKLVAEHAKREAVLKAHVDAKFKAHSNLHTMFGASNGVFDRLPTHPSQNQRRGSPAHRSFTPARRIVPARLARLEDLRMQARRRTYSRGMMADRYHQQLHGENLGVFAGPGEYEHPDAFLQMNEDGVVHDAPAMRQAPH